MVSGRPCHRGVQRLPGAAAASSSSSSAPRGCSSGPAWGLSAEGSGDTGRAACSGGASRGASRRDNPVLLGPAVALLRGSPQQLFPPPLVAGARGGGARLERRALSARPLETGRPAGQAAAAADGDLESGDCGGCGCGGSEEATDGPAAAAALAAVTGPGPGGGCSDAVAGCGLAA